MSELDKELIEKVEQALTLPPEEIIKRDIIARVRKVIQNAVRQEVWANRRTLTEPGTQRVCNDVSAALKEYAPEYVGVDRDGTIHVALSAPQEVIRIVVTV